MNTYYLGETVILDATFTRADNTPYEAEAVEVTVIRGDGTLLDPAPVATTTSTGKYEATVVADQVGHWEYRFLAVGDITTAKNGRFYVRESSFD